ncbi:MAG TPA: response regulator [Kofleriaceae bacterium]|nr:response regulator [Kofleriaceae bacterium]
MQHVVLVVDDDRDIRDSLIELLEDHGYRAAGAANGLEALTVLGASAPLPCLILLDLMMPVMDGQEFREQQLKNPAWAQIPVVAISAYSDAVARARALDLECLRKPLTMRPLIEMVRRHCAGA